MISRMEDLKAESDDSFYSFVQSERDSCNVSDSSDFDWEKNKEILKEVSQTGIPEKLSKYQLLEKPSINSNHMVLKPSSSRSQIPDDKLFDLEMPLKKVSLDVSPKTEALEKFAFTKSWIENNNSAPKRSPYREFLSALDGYFNKKTNDQFKKLTPQKKEEGNVEKKLFIEPTQSGPAQSITFQSVTDIEPYISPFEDMPMMPPEKKLPGKRPYITVPAGFDLTNLVKYKNPNHWHRRPTTRNDTRP